MKTAAYKKNVRIGWSFWRGMWREYDQQCEAGRYFRHHMRRFAGMRKLTWKWDHEDIPE